MGFPDNKNIFMKKLKKKKKKKKKRGKYYVKLPQSKCHELPLLFELKDACKLWKPKGVLVDFVSLDNCY